jgi:DNA-binding GntR family transcriptional regulator
MATDKSLSNRVFDQIRKEILAGQLRPGDPLSEREVSLRANVSRVPVREALIRLEAKGLIVLTKDRGGMVRTFGIDDIRHLQEVRESLEGLAARLAAGQIPSKQLWEFEKAMRVFRRSSNSGDTAQLWRANAQFHEAIIANCGNPLLQRSLADIREQIQLSRALMHSKQSFSDVLQRVQDHLTILRALKSGDGAKAEEHMRVHISRWRTINL